MQYFGQHNRFERQSQQGWLRTVQRAILNVQYFSPQATKICCALFFRHTVYFYLGGGVVFSKSQQAKFHYLGLGRIFAHMYVAMLSPLQGACAPTTRAARLASLVVLRATNGEPLNNALVHIVP